jgi:hypothetical protein
MERLLQLLTSVAFLVLCVVGIAVGLKALRGPSTGTADGTGDGPAVESQAQVYQVGERISLDKIDFSQAYRTLVLVVRQDCRFCDDSMPFYKRLGDDDEIGRRTRIVMVAPDDEEVSRAGLQSRGIRVDQILRVGVDQLRVRGTPTAIVVNAAGVVQRILTGRLAEPQQAELIGYLRTGS